jgi:hypothetical protein
MEVSGQLEVSTALTQEKELAFPTGQGAGWTSGPVYLWKYSLLLYSEKKDTGRVLYLGFYAMWFDSRYQYLVQTVCLHLHGNVV